MNHHPLKKQKKPKNNKQRSIKSQKFQENNHKDHISIKLKWNQCLNYLSFDKSPTTSWDIPWWIDHSYIRHSQQWIIVLPPNRYGKWYTSFVYLIFLIYFIDSFLGSLDDVQKDLEKKEWGKLSFIYIFFVFWIIFSYGHTKHLLYFVCGSCFWGNSCSNYMLGVTLLKIPGSRSWWIPCWLAPLGVRVLFPSFLWYDKPLLCCPWSSSFPSLIFHSLKS